MCVHSCLSTKLSHPCPFGVDVSGDGDDDDNGDANDGDGDDDAMRMIAMIQ